MTEHYIDLAPGLHGALNWPGDARDGVLLVDGSAGVRDLERQRFIAGYLQRRQLGTLRLEPAADAPPGPRVADGPAVARLAHRLIKALAWVGREPRLQGRPVAVFGMGAGAAAAFACAAEQPARIGALVCVAAPLDLVEADVARVQAPTLLVVGGLDAGLLEVTRAAYRRLSGEKRLEVVPRATRLFEEAGALERVALAAADWVGTHLA